MNIAVYQINFPDPQSAGEELPLSVETHEEISRALGLKEWLYLVYPAGGDFLAFAEDPPNTATLKTILSDYQIIPDNPATTIQQINGRQALSHYFRIAANIADQPAAVNSMEILHRTHARAAEYGCVGMVFQRLFQTGILLHEKARQETQYFHFATDPVIVFRELAEKVLGRLKNLQVFSAGHHPRLPAYWEELQLGGCRKWVRCASKLPAATANWQIDDRGKDIAAEHLLKDMDEAAIWLILPGAPATVSEDVLLRRARRRNGPLIILDIDGRRFHRKNLKKLDRVYLYTAGDIDKIIAMNRSEQNQSRQHIEAWISDEIEHFRRWLDSEERYHFAGMIGSTARMQRIFELISRISRTDITVLIDGESGTGKELVARAVHQLSNRAEFPFKVVNCGAIPENLLESELFGYVRGAFTGAVAPRPGLFESADGGTVFLDEIAELPPQLQVKLLRFLQEGEIKRVGSNQTIKVDVRMLAATNKNLSEMVDREAFRSDLYYRLNVIQLTLPPLRDRQADIILLARYFLKTFADKYQKDVQGFSEDVLIALKNYRWPGNIRELENAIERAVALAFRKLISVYELPAAIAEARSASTTQPEGEAPLTLKEIEKHHILKTLDACDWNYDRASRLLEIGRTTLWRKLREYNVVDRNDISGDDDPQNN